MRVPLRFMSTESPLHGEATFELASQAVELRADDYLFLPAGMRHIFRRVTDGASRLFA